MIILYYVSTNEEFNKLLEKYNNEIKLGNELLTANCQLLQQINNLKNENNKLSIENDKLLIENDKLLIDKNNYYNEWQNIKDEMEEDNEIYKFLVNNKKEFDEIMKDWCVIKPEHFKNEDPWSVRYEEYVKIINTISNLYKETLKEILLLIPFIQDKFNNISNKKEYNINKENLKNGFYNFLSNKYKITKDIHSGRYLCVCSFTNRQCKIFISSKYCAEDKSKLLVAKYHDLLKAILVYIAKDYDNPKEELQKSAKITQFSEYLLIKSLEQLKSHKEKEKETNYSSILFQNKKNGQ